MNENNQTNEVIEVTKPYQFRKLCAKDVPLMMKILTKIKLNRFKEVLQDENVIKLFSSTDEENGNNAMIGGGALILDIAQIIFEGLGDCDEIFEMLANTSNLKRKEIEELDLDVLMEMIIDFITKDEFMGFIKVASRLIK